MSHTLAIQSMKIPSRVTQTRPRNSAWTVSESVGTNTRVRWTFSPLGDLFVVYNHSLRTLETLTRDRAFRFASNHLLVKVQYAFRY